MAASSVFADRAQPGQSSVQAKTRLLPVSVYTGVARALVSRALVATHQLRAVVSSADPPPGRDDDPALFSRTVEASATFPPTDRRPSRRCLPGRPVRREGPE